MEDFTTYTETDPDAKLTVTSSKITIASGSDNNTYNVYKDFTTDYFNALDADFTIRLTTGVTTDSQIGVAFVNTATPSTENAGGNLDTTDLYVCGYWYNATYIYLNRGNFAAVADFASGLSLDTDYYCTIVRTASSDTVTCEIYTDSGRTSLYDTLSVSGYGTGTKWQYCYGLMNAEFNENNVLNGYIENLELNISSTSVKTYLGLATASVKTIDGLAIASRKTWDGLA